MEGLGLTAYGLRVETTIPARPSILVPRDLLHAGILSSSTFQTARVAQRRSTTCKHTKHTIHYVTSFNPQTDSSLAKP